MSKTFVPDKVSASVASLLDLSEQAEIVASNMTFVIKFNKDKSGNIATPAMIQDLASSADAVMQQILQDVKVIRVLAPKLAN